MSGSDARHQNPLARARGLGSAKDGSHHWWVQRVSAVALALLTPWFLYLIIGLVGADQATARAAIAPPLTASLLIAYVLALFWHARLGVQVVIEDYVHARALEVALQLAVRFIFALAAIISVIAIGRVAFMA